MVVQSPRGEPGVGGGLGYITEACTRRAVVCTDSGALCPGEMGSVDLVYVWGRKTPKETKSCPHIATRCGCYRSRLFLLSERTVLF